MENKKSETNVESDNEYERRMMSEFKRDIGLGDRSNQELLCLSALFNAVNPGCALSKHLKNKVISRLSPVKVSDQVNNEQQLTEFKERVAKRIEQSRILEETCKDAECPICRELMTKDLIETECKHVFHAFCLVSYFTQANKRKCPMCRGDCKL